MAVTWQLRGPGICSRGRRRDDPGSVGGTEGSLGVRETKGSVRRAYRRVPSTRNTRRLGPAPAPAVSLPPQPQSRAGSEAMPERGRRSAKPELGAWRSSVNDTL